MYSLKELLKRAIEIDASDLHIVVGAKPAFRIDGELKWFLEEELKAEDVSVMVNEILKEKTSQYNMYGEYDTAYEVKDLGRFRVNVFKERNKDAIAIRIIKDKILTLDEIGAPEIIGEFIKEKRGLILITGQTGSGKSTTIASMIQEINLKRSCRIITLEEPIEYVYKNYKSLITQREIGRDTKGYEEGIKAALREDPDVILIGEMRSIETIKIALTAAETGHLVLSTLHTFGVSATIGRIIHSFPKEQQEEIRIQLSMILKGVIWQKLVRRKDGQGRVAAYEVLNVVPAIRNLIREGKNFQINSLIQTGKKHGMISMDRFIASLYEKGHITREEALVNCEDKKTLDTSI